MKTEAHFQDIYDLCKRHIHSYVLVELEDGKQFDGIITGLDKQYVYFALPVEPRENTANINQVRRPFGGGYSGHGPFPRRRFNRFVLPLAALATLSLLPWY